MSVSVVGFNGRYTHKDADCFVYGFDTRDPSVEREDRTESEFKVLFGHTSPECQDLIIVTFSIFN